MYISFFFAISAELVGFDILALLAPVHINICSKQNVGVNVCVRGEFTAIVHFIPTRNATIVRLYDTYSIYVR